MPAEPIRISEGELVIPALRALIDNQANGLCTTELIKLLRKEFKPVGKDAEISPHRGDDYFSEKVRNLRSHNKLTNANLAVIRDGQFYITKVGKEFVANADGVFNCFIKQGFSQSATNRAVSPNRQFLFIEEGGSNFVTRKVRRRSTTLREYAKKHFRNSDGSTSCIGCGFESANVYGDEARGIIEFHHKRPIALAGETRKHLSEALKNIAPLCPNCHRVVHMNSGKIISISELKKMMADTK